MTLMTKASASHHLFEISQTAEGHLRIAFCGNLDIVTVPTLLKDVQASLKPDHPVAVTIDLEKVNRMDDYGALLIAEIKCRLNLADERFAIINAKDDLARTLSLINVACQQRHPLTPRKSGNIVVQFGDSTINTLLGVKFFVAFIGSIVLSFIRIIRSPKSLRYSDTVQYMKSTGVDALPVVALISFLLGLIIAFMSSLQLKPFGANIYVASLVAMAMVSELGPIMTAIVVAGRSGSAYAAEISSMKISEEIDALFIMGFDPTLFLVIPRLIASVIVIPLLTAFADVFAVAGGLVIGMTMLNLSPSAYITQTIHSLSLFEFTWGLFKSGVFAILIAVTGCLRGFQAKGGASAVGNAATSAVVSSIFLVILFDSLFAVIRSYW